MSLLDAVDEVSWYGDEHSGALLQVLYGACQVAISVAVQKGNKQAGYALLGLGLANVGLAVPRLFQNYYTSPAGLSSPRSFSPVERIVLNELNERAFGEQYVQL